MSQLSHQIRFACSLLLLAAAPTAAVHGQDEALVDVLADVLAVEDARRYDAAVLQAAATHPDPIVRRHAALAVGRIGDERGLHLLEDLALDPDTTVQLDGVFSLGLLGDRESLELLETLIQRGSDISEEVQVEAVTAIAKIGGTRARDLLERWLVQRTGNPAMEPLSRAAIRALGEAWRFGDVAPVITLTRTAEGGSAEARKQAIYSLFRLRSPQAAGIFLSALDDPDPDIRAFATRVLTRDYARRTGLDKTTTAARVRDLADDGDAGVRITALRTLGSYQDPRLTDAVVTAAADARAGVAVTALDALGRLGGPRAIEVLADHVDRGRFALREQALLGLARADRTLGIRKAAAWIQSEDWLLRLAGARALGVLGGDTAAAWLMAMTADVDARVVGVALAALGEAAPDRARELARSLLTHLDVVVRARAAGVLGHDPRAEDVEALIAAYAAAAEDADNDARLAIIRTLGHAVEEGHAEPDVAQKFFELYPTSDDYLARRAAREFLPSVGGGWGGSTAVNTGRAKDDYRRIVRRLLLPAERGRRFEWVIDTERGRITVELFAADAPMTTAIFLDLAESGYFDGTRWHRVVANFVIQGGDPRGDGAGGPGFTIRDEINRHRYLRGTVGVALSGPDTGGSQFFITHAPQPHLDGTFTVFGRVITGMNAVEQTMRGDQIRTVRKR